MDYRRPENRKSYFTALYAMNLYYGVMPGLVYLYFPLLRKHFGWDAETALWAAFVNGLTQSPITTLRILEQLPEVPPDNSEGVARLSHFREWFNAEWNTLHFDTDRRYGKRHTAEAIASYMQLVGRYGTQENIYTPDVDLLPPEAYAQMWERANSVFTLGRLSTFSYLEYVRIMGHGAECVDLMLEDRDGSRSHRNGMLFLIGKDELVWDKRAGNGFDGSYDNFSNMCSYLQGYAVSYINEFNTTYPALHADQFTFESQCCQFKNGFFGRRYPGVYSDMAYDRIQWYEQRNVAPHLTKLFRQLREDNLPEWLRMECDEKSAPNVKQRKEQFMLTGVPYRAEHFL